jgi:caffeic acid 3-O-methyltransferase
VFRIMRLSAAIGVMEEEASLDSTLEEEVFVFRLTKMGALLQTNVNSGQTSLASCVQHWNEQPLWNSWLKLPDYITGSKEETDLPFDRANGMSSDEYYGHDKKSLGIANDFVRFIHDGEVAAVVNGFDWNTLSGKTVVDVGGHNGKVIGAVAAKFPTVQCICLDLPEVVASAATPPTGVKLVGGDIMDPSTIPKCDAIFMKHILDKSMWNEKESVAILKSCHAALPEDGRVIIGEAVLPNAGKGKGSMQLFIDAQFVLVGRKGQRTEHEWVQLAAKADFKIERIIETSSVSCYIIVYTFFYYCLRFHRVLVRPSRSINAISGRRTFIPVHGYQ